MTAVAAKTPVQPKTPDMQATFTLNGAPHAAENRSVAQLLEQLGYAEKRVAVERNGAILPKSLHAATLLAAGDEIEIVQAIGGG
jgi:sulfur carrier protein